MFGFRHYALATVFAAAFGVLSGPVSAKELSLQPEESRLEITFRQMNAPVQAVFGRFDVSGSFDAAAPQSARAEVSIDTTSFDFGPGAEEYNAEAQGEDWLDAESHPRAVLVLNGASPDGEGRFIASGELTIKGTTQPVTVPVTLKQEGEKRVFSGEVTIQRLAFGIGAGDWADTSIVEDDVIVSFTLHSK